MTRNLHLLVATPILLQSLSAIACDKNIEFTPLSAICDVTIEKPSVLIAEAETTDHGKGNWTFLLLTAVNKETGYQIQTQTKENIGTVRANIYIPPGRYEVAAWSENFRATAKSVKVWIQK